MSWPPQIFDRALNAQLLSLLDEQEAAMDRILNVAAELERLRAEKDRLSAQSLSAEDLVPRVEELILAAEKANQPTYAALACLLAGEILLAAGKPEDALTRLCTGRAVWAAGIAKQEAPERALDVQFLELMARVHFQMKNYGALSAVCAEAIEKVEEDRYKTNAPYLQSAYLKDRASLYKHGIGSAYRLRDYETMLARAELSKARAILRYSEESAAAAPDSQNERLFRTLSDEIRVRDPAGSAKPGTVEGLDALLEERRRVWDLLSIARFTPNGDRAARPPLFCLPQIRQGVAEDEAVLYYYWLDPSILLVSYLDRHDLWVEPVAVDAAGQRSLKDVLAGIRLYPGDLGEPEQRKFDRAIRDCAYLLPDAFRAAIQGKRRLVICPHQSLHLFPFHALSWAGGALIEKVAISYAPNLTILGMPRVAARPARVLLASAGHYDPCLQVRQLPQIGRELEGAAEAYRQKDNKPDMLAGSRLTRKGLRDWSDSGRLAGYSVIHLATHGISIFARESLDTPMESLVFLNSSAFDGLEISRLRLDADLVVLSACNAGQRAITGRGMEELPGDELFGMQAAFAMAGARSILGCLWPVGDNTAQEIMVRFHGHRADRMPPEVALQKATVEYLQSGGHRFCHQWAPFFLSILGARNLPWEESSEYA